MAASIEKIADSTITIGANTEGLEAVSDVVKVSTELTPAKVEALDQVMTKVVDVIVQSRTANAPALQAIAQAVTPAAAGAGGAAAARSSQKTVQLVLNDRVFGDVVVDVLNDKFDLTMR